MQKKKKLLKSTDETKRFNNFSHDSNNNQDPQLQLGSQPSLHQNIWKNEI